jgi:hypothetical protein
VVSCQRPIRFDIVFRCDPEGEACNVPQLIEGELNNDLERRACAAILHAADDDTPIPPQIMAEIESMTPERREAVAQAAARVMTDRQALVEVHETLNEMIADGEVTAKIDPVTGEVGYRRVSR